MKHLALAVRASTNALAETQAQLKDAELGVQAARVREQLTARTYSAFAGRARQELAPAHAAASPCWAPTCSPAARCPRCNKPLTSLLVPTRTANLDQNEYIALLGALGVLVGLALTTDQSAD